MRDGKAVPDYAKFNIQSSINQQNEYLKIADEISKNYPNIKVYNIANDTEKGKEEIKHILNF